MTTAGSRGRSPPRERLSFAAGDARSSSRHRQGLSRYTLLSLGGRAFSRDQGHGRREVPGTQTLQSRPRAGPLEGSCPHFCPGGGERASPGGAPRPPGGPRSGPARRSGRRMAVLRAPPVNVHVPYCCRFPALPREQVPCAQSLTLRSVSGGT